jgi:hypothetical protein
MMTARKAQLAVLTAILATSVTGCGIATGDSGDVAADKASSAPADPRDVLLAAVPDEKVGAFAFAVKGGVTPTSGVLDSPKKAVEIKIEQAEPDVGFTMTMTTRMIGEKSWIKVAFTPATVPGLPKLPKKWLLLDPAKVNDKDMIGYDGSTDPGYATELVDHGAGIKETSPGHFAGTTDLTKSTDAEIVDEKTLTALGAKAKTVPFSAVVDGQGHLTTLTLK